MDGVVRGGTVPLTISYRKVTKRPEIKKHRRFVGFREIGRRIGAAVIETALDLAYDVETEVLDAGETEVVHWALNIEDPWGPNNSSMMRCTRLPEKPPAGMSLEVVKILDEEGPPKPEEEVAYRGPNHDRARARMAQALQRDGHYDPEAGPPTGGTPVGYAGS